MAKNKLDKTLQNAGVVDTNDVILKFAPEFFTEEFLETTKLKQEDMLAYFKRTLGVAQKGVGIAFLWKIDKAIFAKGKAELCKQLSAKLDDFVDHYRKTVRAAFKAKEEAEAKAKEAAAAAKADTAVNAEPVNG